MLPNSEIYFPLENFYENLLGKNETQEDHYAARLSAWQDIFYGFET